MGSFHTMNKNLYSTGALFSGGMLGVMLFLNSGLAQYTSPSISSLIVHFVGIFASWLIWKLISKRKVWIPFSVDAPIWTYLGGICGAMIVLISNITVNSSIGLVGSLSLMILGQTSFAILFDLKGWFGMKKRKIHLRDLLQVGCILAGCFLLIVK